MEPLPSNGHIRRNIERIMLETPVEKYVDAHVNWPLLLHDFKPNWNK
jgi:hypothetical protein